MSQPFRHGSLERYGRLPARGDVSFFLINPDSGSVLYLADQNSDEVIELYEVAAAGSPSS